MNITAAVLREQGAPHHLEQLDLDPPGPGEVLVEVKAAGVCHSDLHAARGDWPMSLPLVLGHEGAGIVRAVGDAVTGIAAGDHVVFCWAPACRACPACLSGLAVVCDRLDKTVYRNRLPGGGTRLHRGDERIGAFLGTACFADFTVVDQAGAVVVPRDVPFDVLGTLGCAVVTGVGAVLTCARVPRGARVAVIGAGGVGLNVIQGAALAGSAQIVSIDRAAAPLALARAFGATDVVESPETAAGAIRALTSGRGADYVFDTVGTPATVIEAINATRKGGTAVVTGLGRVDELTPLPMFPFVMQEKRLLGSVYGSGDPAHDIVRLVRLYQEGTLKLRELTSRTYRLSDIDEALGALARAEGARGVVLW